MTYSAHLCPNFVYLHGQVGVIVTVKIGNYTLLRFSFLSLRSGSVQRSSIVMVGFTDGYVRGYSKSGQRVFSRLMHLEPVAKLTCMASSTVQRPALGLVCGLHRY